MQKMQAKMMMALLLAVLIIAGCINPVAVGPQVNLNPELWYHPEYIRGFYHAVEWCQDYDGDFRSDAGVQDFITYYDFQVPVQAFLDGEPDLDRCSDSMCDYMEGLYEGFQFMRRM